MKKRNRWEITSEQSNYDWRVFRETDHGKYFKTVGNVYKDWKKEVEFGITQQHDMYWSSPAKPGDKYDYTFEKNLCLDWGIPLDFVTYRSWTVTEECPILNSIAEEVGIANAQICLQTQNTGMILHLHIDSLTGLRDNERKNTADQRNSDPEWERCFVMLEDWAPGHILQFGNSYIPPWRAGDVIWFDWANVPHSTVNTSPWPRHLLKVTGKITDKYRKLIKETKNDRSS